MLEAFGLTDRGCVRSNNEDYFRLVPAMDLYVVADGMGGAQAGEQASRLAGDTVVDYVSRSGSRSPEVLLQAVSEANRRVLETAGSDPDLRGMGTTLTAAWRLDDELLLANVGDSRAYVLEDGQLRILTEDQTWVHEVGRRLGIQEDQLRAHPMRHVLTMAIGISDTLRVHTYNVPLRPGSCFLLCSDGLHGVVSPQTIAETLAGPGTLESKCHSLIQAARQAGGPDNITAVLVGCS